MQVPTAVSQVLTFLVSTADEVPEADDVKAGWLALVIFVLLILAVVFLGFSLVKRLRRAEAAEKAGLYAPSRRTRGSEAEPAQESGQEPGPETSPDSNRGSAESSSAEESRGEADAED